MAIRNDKELIEFCKDNNYIHIDYSPRLTEYNQKSVDCFNELLRIKTKDKKYDKCIFSINTEKIHKILRYKIITSLGEEDLDPFEYTIYMNKIKKMFLSNKVNVNKHQLRGLLDLGENSCVICLETIKKGIEEYSACITCSAIYHTDCLHDKDYPCHDGLNKFCCICKEAIGLAVLS